MKAHLLEVLLDVTEVVLLSVLVVSVIKNFTPVIYGFS